ncbi:MAG: hypothetical protein H6920_01490 [Sphingomonadaceae bacterium]|nr:hypothetical protein [Sphingomonadaceae bacterium]MCP5390289.1 hypothetical protein [Sphingomonadaceae bacterium]MCP5392379.1 hypothetical protein [Sphingomonadaceae bacterium]
MDDLTQPPSRASRPTDNGVTMQRPFLVALLYLLSIVIGFTSIIGVILAYIWRSDASTQEWEKTHYTYLIRTFWVSFAIGITLMLLWFGTIFGMIARVEHTPAVAHQPPPAMFFVAIFGAVGAFLLSMVWFCIRSILSMVKASNREPMPRPGTWLF